MAEIVRALGAGDLTLKTCQVLFQPNTKPSAFNFGAVQESTASYEKEEASAFSRESRTKREIDKTTTSEKVAVKLSSLHHTALNRLMQYADAGGFGRKVTQAAVVGKTLVIPQAEWVPGAIFELDYGATNVEIEVGGAPAPAGISKVSSSESGLSVFAEALAPAAGDVTLTYDTVAIAVADGHAVVGFMANNPVRGKLTILGTNEKGARERIDLWDVEMRPAGDISFMGDDDYSKIELEGTVYYDSAKAQAYGARVFGFGMVRPV